MSIKIAKFVKWSHLQVIVPLSRDASQQPSVDQPPPLEFLKTKELILIHAKLGHNSQSQTSVRGRTDKPTSYIGQGVQSEKLFFSSRCF